MKDKLRAMLAKWRLDFDKVTEDGVMRTRVSLFRAVIIFIVLAYGNAPANAVDLSEKWRVGSLKDDGSKICGDLKEQMEALIRAGVINACLIPRPKSAKSASDIDWTTVDYTKYVDEIKNAYISYQAYSGSFAQRVIGQEYPEVVENGDVSVNRQYALLFWAQYGQQILDKFKAGQLTLKEAHIDVFETGVLYPLIRVPIIAPDETASNSLAPLYCDSSRVCTQ